MSQGPCGESHTSEGQAGQKGTLAGARDEGQQDSICLVGMRPWVGSLAPCMWTHAHTGLCVL